MARHCSVSPPSHGTTSRTSDPPGARFGSLLILTDWPERGRPHPVAADCSRCTRPPASPSWLSDCGWCGRYRPAGLWRGLELQVVNTPINTHINQSQLNKWNRCLTSPARGRVAVGQISTPWLDSQSVGKTWDQIWIVQGGDVFGKLPSFDDFAVLEQGNSNRKFIIFMFDTTRLSQLMWSWYGLTTVDREMMYLSRSPSPGVQVTNSLPTESVLPGWGARWRFLTLLGTGAESLRQINSTPLVWHQVMSNFFVSPVRPSINCGLWYAPLNVDTTIL